MKSCNRRSFFVMLNMVLFLGMVPVYAQDGIIATDETIDSIVAAEIDRLGNDADLNHIDVSAVTDMSELFEDSDFNGDISEWDVGNVTDMSRMFCYAYSFNQDIGSWDVRNVIDMSEMFLSDIFIENEFSSFNQDISAWDVGNVTDMSGMFVDATSFNQDINSWDVGNVTDMSEMFGYSSFNQDIGEWDVGNVIDMSNMFIGADSFNQDIGEWDVGNVTDISKMFYNATSFNQDIGEWDVGNVTDISKMFYNADSFNQDIGSWDVGNVTDMKRMFYNATSFNQDIGSWDVGNVVYMIGMFSNADSFNHDIGSWDVGSVMDMGRMFIDADSFNQDIGSWDVENVVYMRDMFSNATLSIQNYDALLEGWAALAQDSGVQENISFSGGNSKYFSDEAQAAHQYLVDEYGWSISDGGKAEEYYTLALTAENGNITANPVLEEYLEGTEVTLTGEPNEGYTFTGWSGDVSEEEVPLTIIIENDMEVEALFEPYFILTLSAENGTITPAPNIEEYPNGTGVELTAEPNQGYDFTSWSGDVTGSENPLMVIVEEDMEVVALFEKTTAIIYDKKISHDGASRGVCFSQNPVSVNDETADIRVVTGDPARVTITIADILGNIIDQQEVRVQGNEAEQFIWDLRNRQGMRVSAGSYAVTAKVEYHSGETQRYQAVLGVRK